MIDLSTFDINAAGNPENNIFGLPFKEEDARLIFLPVPWEVTVSYGAGTARCAEQILKASLQVDLFDMNAHDAWKEGMYLRELNKKILIKSDYLRKEAELFIDFISKGNDIQQNRFMCKSLQEINEGSLFLNKWVYEQTQELLRNNKLVCVLGGDHSTPLGYLKALSEQHSNFGILQIDAHCDLRESYEHFTYSHASAMYNALKEIPQITKLVQIGIRDFSEVEWNFVCNSNYKIVSYLGTAIHERMFEGETWKSLTQEIIQHLPEKVYLTFDIDGLDSSLCPNTGTPVPGGLRTEHVLYLIKKLLESGRKLIGFDLVEVGIGENSIDSIVAARLLWNIGNLFIKNNN